MRAYRIGSIAALVLLLVPSALPAHATTASVLYAFVHPCCGYPYGPLALMNGNLFGTGAGDGYSGHHGQVFELKGGSWTQTSPHAFKGSDGSQPSAGLTSDSSGDLYGTTALGDTYGGGNAFYMFNSGGKWYFEKMWAFGGTGDGANPICDLVLDGSGNVYGTTASGGADGGGIAFELSHNSAEWTETILHSFGSGSDGNSPQAGLVRDGAGNLYGTTLKGGAHGYGTVFELTHSGGKWSEKVLHSFGSNSTDGRSPYASLIIHSAGVLYGTTAYGGTNTCTTMYHCGTFFKVYMSSGVWKEQVLYNFTGKNDGAYPVAKLTANGSNTLYGTAYTGGTSGQGTVFKLTYSSSMWHETTLVQLSSIGAAYPYGAVIRDSSGNLYGTTVEGGDPSCNSEHGCGTVWEVVP